MAKYRKRSTKKNKTVRSPQQLGFLAVISVVVLGFIAFLAYQTLPSDSEVPDEVDSIYSGLERSVTAEGYAQLGDPDAEIIIREYSSFSCSHCKSFEELVNEEVLPYIESGDVRLIMIFVNRGAPDEKAMIRAAYCAIEQDRFWEMQHTIFHWQGLVSFSDSRVEDAAKELNMEDVDAFMDCYYSVRTDELLQQAEDDFSTRGFSYTPTVLINNRQINDYRTVPDEIRALLNR